MCTYEDWVPTVVINLEYCANMPSYMFSKYDIVKLKFWELGLRIMNNMNNIELRIQLRKDNGGLFCSLGG